MQAGDDATPNPVIERVRRVQGVPVGEVAVLTLDGLDWYWGDIVIRVMGTGVRRVPLPYYVAGTGVNNAHAERGQGAMEGRRDERGAVIYEHGVRGCRSIRTIACPIVAAEDHARPRGPAAGRILGATVVAEPGT